jgi:hypothetical protein
MPSQQQYRVVLLRRRAGRLIPALSESEASISVELGTEQGVRSCAKRGMTYVRVDFGRTAQHQGA